MSNQGMRYLKIVAIWIAVALVFLFIWPTNGLYCEIWK